MKPRASGSQECGRDARVLSKLFLGKMVGSKGIHINFQIAERSVQLEDPVSTQWTGVQLDSLNDLIASKMVALVERGAPRDFLDIFAVCEADIATPRACWRLWQTRQARTGGSTSFSRAKLAITTHLKRIELRRPLYSIDDQRPRNEAEKTRNWFRKEFLNAGMD